MTSAPYLDDHCALPDVQGGVVDNLKKRLPSRNTFAYDLSFDESDAEVSSGAHGRSMVSIDNRKYLLRLERDIFATLSACLKESIRIYDARVSDAVRRLPPPVAPRSFDVSSLCGWDALVQQVIHWVHHIDRPMPPRSAKLPSKVRHPSVAIKPRLDQPLLVTGPSGCGKTSLLQLVAQGVLATRETHPFAVAFVTIGRNIGAADGRTALHSLVSQIFDVLGKPASISREADFNALLTATGDALRGLSDHKRLLLIVDGLDALPASDYAHRLTWLPTTLTTTLRIIVSSRDAAATALRVADANRLPVPPMSIDDAAVVLDRTLAAAGRTLTQDQKAKVLNSFASDMLPAAVVSAGLLARSWTSADGTADVLTAASRDRAVEWLRSLSTAEADALALLSVARHGLTDDELADLLRLVTPAARLRLLQRLGPLIAPSFVASTTVLAIKAE